MRNETFWHSLLRRSVENEWMFGPSLQGWSESDVPGLIDGHASRYFFLTHDHLIDFYPLFAAEKQSRDNPGR